jgi:ribosomal protein S18 acetylase RimI-like enzyme
MKFSKTVGSTYFKLEQLALDAPIDVFSCSVAEYDEYLQKDAMRFRKDHIALTWLLRERSSGKIAAYMSLIADAIKLSVSEKELHDLNYPFKTIPAVKIAKLAVSQDFANKYKGIGSFMISSARTIARKCNNHYCACRFLTVDADIEHNEGVRAFYEKNGFLLNSELYNKNRKTINMRKDLYR